SIVRRKAFAAGEIEYLREGARGGLLVRRNRQNLQPRNKVSVFSSGDTPAALAERQHVGDFQMPYRRNGGIFSFETVKQPIGGLRQLVFEAPGKSDGSMEHKTCHRRPCSINFLTGMPSVLPSRAVLSHSIASRRLSGPAWLTGIR